jgi:histone H4
MAKGKSGAADSGKRVKKLVRSNVDSVSQGSIRRLARRAGVKRIAAPIYNDVRSVLHTFVEGVVRDACAIVEHSRRKTVSASAIVQALRKRGRTLYGYA